MKQLKAVELFAGIGGFRVACDRLGFDTVFANDICPKATRVYADRFGGITVGDVTQLLDSIPPHDLLTAGIPCQPFSAAGKKRGVQDPRGTLFQTVVDILRSHRPRYFVIENVKRLLTMEDGLHFATILSALAELDYDIEWRLINAMHFGLAQNRQRIVITGIRQEVTSEVRVRLLAEAELEALSSAERMRLFDRQVWRSIDAHGSKFSNWGRASNGLFFDADIPSFADAAPQVKLDEILQDNVSSSFDFTESMSERIANSTPVNQYVQSVQILYNQGGGARMGYTVFGTAGVAPTVTSTASRHYERYKVGDRYRRLTNVEYARLQGFADDHCSCVSVNDQYPLYGNAFPPPMAEWALRRITGTASLSQGEIRETGQLAFCHL